MFLYFAISSVDFFLFFDRRLMRCVPPNARQRCVALRLYSPDRWQTQTVSDEPGTERNRFRNVGSVHHGHNGGACVDVRSAWLLQVGCVTALHSHRRQIVHRRRRIRLGLLAALDPGISGVHRHVHILDSSVVSSSSSKEFETTVLLLDNNDFFFLFFFKKTKLDLSVGAQRTSSLESSHSVCQFGVSSSRRFFTRCVERAAWGVVVFLTPVAGARFSVSFVRLFLSAAALPLHCIVFVSAAVDHFYSW